MYTGGSSSIVYSRVECPRAQSTSTRSVTNGSVIVSRGFEPDDLTTVRAALGLYLHAAEEDGPIQPVLHENVARGDLNLEALQLLRRSIQVDGGIERSIQRRQKMYVSETEREPC